MDLSDISIATITWARTQEEQSVLRSSLQVLAKLKLRVVTADGGSPPEFLSFLRKLDFEVIPPTKRGLVPQVKASLRAAHKKFGSPYILYTEPDKEPFFRGKLEEFVAKCSQARGPAVFVPDRDPKSFATFPAIQRLTESFTNRICQELLGVPGDITYGPLLLPRELLSSLKAAPDTLGWGWRPYVLARARKAGLPIRHIKMSLPCPVDQRGENSQADKLYRTTQLRQGLEGLLLGLRD